MFENLSVTDSFKNSIETALSQSRLSHALIFEGADEETCLSAAKQTAAAICCEGVRKPCGGCSNCLKAFNDCHPDIHILTKDEDSRLIKVDFIRELRRLALIYPNESKKSVFIIHGANFMNVQAQNALLKIFEEPSAHVCFILTCDSKASLLDTVISRATVYNLGEFIVSSETEDELSEANVKAGKLIELFIKESEFAFLKETSVFLKDKKFFSEVLSGMLSLFRDALILCSGGNDINNKNRHEVTLIRDYLTRKKIFKAMESIKELISDVDSSSNHNLTITRLSSVLYDIKNS